MPPPGPVSPTAYTTAAVMVRELDVTGVSPVGVKVTVKEPAVPVITRLVKVATPALAATVVVPLRVPVPDAMDATTLTLELVTVVPLASTMRMTGWVPSAAPLAAPVGCVVIAAAVAVPAAGAPLVGAVGEAPRSQPATSTTHHITK